MSKYVAYFAALIFVLFGVAFYSAMQGFKKLDNDETIADSKRERE
jgi:hypothetical protein